MPAWDAIIAGMQYTLRNIPEDLDRALREWARRENRSLNEVAVEALRAAVGLGEEPVVRRDLSDVAGSWIDDPEIDAALADQRRIDEDLWR
jgi:plasmid stability protein